MAFDFKKEYKELYLPKETPTILDIPAMNYIALRGQGNPNEAGGSYQKAISILYAVAYTLKMSYRGGRAIEGFFEYVVPPLEGFWWQEGVRGVDYARKERFNWISVLRLPDFIAKADFDWAVQEAGRKKGMDCTAAEFLTIQEGLCAQILHVGAYDDEPATVARMEAYVRAQGYVVDINQVRMHHEIYLSDPKQVEPAKRKTVIRHPVKRA